MAPAPALRRRWAAVDRARQHENQFIDDILQSRGILLEDWRNRGILQRVRELVSWPVEYWL